MRILPSEPRCTVSSGKPEQVTSIKIITISTECEWKDVKSSEENSYQIIQLANQNIPILSLLEASTFEIKDSPSGWTHLTNCIFPDHNENTPSFSVNPTRNCFNCFGCHRGGGPVQIIATLKGITSFEAATQLLKDNNFTSEDLYLDLLEHNNSKIQEVLINFSAQIRNFLKTNPSKMKLVESITWNLDIYLEKHVKDQSINVENLEMRIKELSEILKEYS